MVSNHPSFSVCSVDTPVSLFPRCWPQSHEDRVTVPVSHHGDREVMNEAVHCY